MHEQSPSVGASLFLRIIERGLKKSNKRKGNEFKAGRETGTTKVKMGEEGRKGKKKF